MTRFEFDPKWVFFELVPCEYIERCGKESLYPVGHPTAPEHKKLFARGLCASCYFHLSKLSRKTTCAGCERFIVTDTNAQVITRYRHRSRGLCNACFMQHKRGGTLDHFPKGGPWKKPSMETVTLICAHRLNGWTRQRIASAMGLSLSTVDRVIRAHSIPKGTLVSPAA